MFVAAASMDPYDCYNGDGSDYPGLHCTTKGGRSCQKWLDTEPHNTGKTAGDKGMGNHNYCRNPDGKEQPYCYTMDTDMEWEYCTVPKCLPESETPQQWLAPAGLKSAEAEAEGPCEPEPDTSPKWEPFEINLYGKALDSGACKNSAGSNTYLIGGSLQTADSADDCNQICIETAGAKFATHWDKAFDDGNCGCYRECLPTDKPEDGAVNFPATVKFPSSFLQKRVVKKRCKQVQPATPEDPMVKVRARAAAASHGHADSPVKRTPEQIAKTNELAEQLTNMMNRDGWAKDRNA